MWFVVWASENILEIRHASTLDECMDYCDQLRPLCSRVNLNSDLLNLGWMNCELKNITAQKPISYNYYGTHSGSVDNYSAERKMQSQHDAHR
jgi:hypothetical protein